MKYKPLRLFLKERNLTLTELHESNICVSEKDNFYIYNYNNAVLVPRDDPIIRICRGIVLDSEGNLMNYPFDRFFNYHEKECDKVDIENSFILEKTDGSLISYWYTGKEWEVTTRGSFYGKGTEGVNFKQEFLKLFNGFTKLDKNYCYQFELCTSLNRIVTRYFEEFVVLIGARSLLNLKELNQNQLDKIAKKLGVRRPKKFKATNIEECRKLFDKMKDDEEGLVVVDLSSNRFKLKQESYLKMARIISLKDQDLLEYVLGEIELDTDFDSMEEVKERIKEIKKLYDDTMNYIKSVYNNLSQYTDRKEFASHATKYKFSSVLFSWLNDKKPNITYKKLVEFSEDVIKTDEKKLLVLRGIPSSGKSSWIKENNLEIYTISPDLLRLMYCAPNPFISQKYNRQVWDLAFSILEIRMSEGSFTVMDGTHPTQVSIKKYQELCKKYGYELEIKDFKITLEEGLRRNFERQKYKQVPEEVIKKMYNQLETQGLTKS